MKIPSDVLNGDFVQFIVNPANKTMSSENKSHDPAVNVRSGTLI